MPRLDATPSGEINHVLQRLNLIGGCQTLLWLLIKLNCMSSNSACISNQMNRIQHLSTVSTLSFVFSFCVNIII